MIDVKPLLEVGIAIVTGIISGIIVGEYYKSENEKYRIRNGLYEYHLFIESIKNELDTLVFNNYTDFWGIKNLLATAKPFFVQYEDCEMKDHVKTAVVKANKLVVELERQVANGEINNGFDVHRWKAKLVRAQFDLLLKRQSVRALGD